MTKNKVMSLKEAVNKFIHDGDTVYVAGFVGGQVSNALINEIIRQRKRDLTITASSFGHHIDPMIGAGCVARIITSYLWGARYGQPYCFRRAYEKGIPRKIEVEDYSNFTMTLRYLIGSISIPFIPVRSLKGSDIVKYRAWTGEKKLKVIEDPFGSNEKFVLVPFLKPDVGIIHSQIADPEGNVQGWGALGDTPMGARACKRVIVTVEEVVDRETIGRDPNRTIIPGYKVCAVIECPWGQHPLATIGYYDTDNEFRFMMTRMAKTLEGFKEYLDEWVYGVSDRSDYISHYVEKYGFARLQRLVARRYMSYSVNYGY